MIRAHRLPGDAFDQRCGERLLRQHTVAPPALQIVSAGQAQRHLGTIVITPGEVRCCRVAGEGAQIQVEGHGFATRAAGRRQPDGGVARSQAHCDQCLQTLIQGPGPGLVDADGAALRVGHTGHQQGSHGTRPVDDSKGDVEVAGSSAEGPRVAALCGRRRKRGLGPVHAALPSARPDINPPRSVRACRRHAPSLRVRS